ncbi:DUF2645 family protein [Cronobacter sakazakii]|nr:DUF2645 family protein [Cronobacter sakazakii]MDQ9194466.1 DUF2645 family protein [Cronobacter sakazakii]
MIHAIQGLFFSLPVFFPAVYAIFIKKNHHWLIWLTTLAIAGYWLWQFFIRYQLCLW